MVIGEKRLAPADAAAMSVRFRTGLGELATGREGVKLRPNELRLGYLICLETFDSRLAGGRIDFDKWARLLDLKDSKGYRADKVASIFKTLNELGVVDLNAAQATFEARPDSTVWLRARAMRARALSTGGTMPQQPLPLRDERPVSEALNELSRDGALAQARSCSQSSDKSDDESRMGNRRINPTTQETGDFAGDSAASDKSDDLRARAGRFETGTRFEEIEKTCTTFGQSSEKSDALRRRVQALVRAFVGDQDWQKKGSWGSAWYVWNDDGLIRLLEGQLNYLKAGLQEGTIRIEKTPGAALWWYYRNAVKQRKAGVGK